MGVPNRYMIAPGRMIPRKTNYLDFEGPHSDIQGMYARTPSSPTSTTRTTKVRCPGVYGTGCPEAREGKPICIDDNLNMQECCEECRDAIFRNHRFPEFRGETERATDCFNRLKPILESLQQRFPGMYTHGIERVCARLGIEIHDVSVPNEPLPIGVVWLNAGMYLRAEHLQLVKLLFQSGRVHVVAIGHCNPQKTLQLIDTWMEDEKYALPGASNIYMACNPKGEQESERNLKSGGMVVFTSPEINRSAMSVFKDGRGNFTRLVFRFGDHVVQILSVYMARKHCTEYFQWLTHLITKTYRLTTIIIGDFNDVFVGSGRADTYRGLRKLVKSLPSFCKTEFARR
jgi:hypothetical protein